MCYIHNNSKGIVSVLVEHASIPAVSTELHIARLCGFNIPVNNDEFLHSHFIYCHSFLDTAARDPCEKYIQITVTHEIYKKREELFTDIF